MNDPLHANKTSAMNTPFNALNEMIRLTSPFPESVTVKDWKAAGKKVIGWFNPYVPEEIIHAAGMLPFEVTGNNEPVQMQGAEALEVSKAAARLPRDQFNELMEQLLDEIQRTGRELKKARRLMIIGNDIHNTNQVAALESLDAVVVVDEMNIGIRYAWGQVDTKLPPMAGTRPLLHAGPPGRHAQLEFRRSPRVHRRHGRTVQG